jgi:hypothetical protein
MSNTTANATTILATYNAACALVDGEASYADHLEDQRRAAMTEAERVCEDARGAKLRAEIVGTETDTPF